MASSDPLTGWRARLRALPVFETEPPEFDADAVPENPLELLAEWLEFAIAAQVPQPHAATLVTVSAEGAPSSRTLIVKDLTGEGLWFATPSDSPAGRDLALNSRAALQLYWPVLGRQIRVEGIAEPGSSEVSHADWAARSAPARAASDPNTWTAYLLHAARIEFLSVAASRAHTRLEYTSPGGRRWSRGMLAG
ncbi:MAG TPA: pyridoxamine 5'-phosphate oxidase family protein [Pseudolysinimonas sp.]|jgi:pyridoxamine 5'-phosphate oxidase